MTAGIGLTVALHRRLRSPRAELDEAKTADPGCVAGRGRRRYLILAWRRRPASIPATPFRDDALQRDAAQAWKRAVLSHAW
jgi:hypothetical protein